MKKTLTSFLILAVASLAIGFTSCKSKPKDADIKAAVEKALAADPMSAGTMVASVDKGVVTITGTCQDEMCKAHCGDLVKGVKGVKEVVNNCAVAPPPAPVEISADDALTTAVKDALLAFPGVNASVKDGVISLTGQIAKADRQKLMMALQALKPKKVDPSALTNK